MTHICVSKLTIIGSDHGLLPGRRQAIIWTNDGILLIGPLGTNFNETLSVIHTFSLKKVHLKMSSGKWRPFCLGPNVFKKANMEILYKKSGPGQNGCQYVKTILEDVFLDENYCTLIKLRTLLWRVLKSTLVQAMAWCQTGNKPLPELIWPKFLMSDGVDFS